MKTKIDFPDVAEQMRKRRALNDNSLQSPWIDVLKFLWMALNAVLCLVGWVTCLWFLCRYFFY